MERRISPQQAAVFKILSPSKWVSANEVAKQCGMSTRCARKHLKLFFDDGLCEIRREFPEFLYRGKEQFEAAQQSYVFHLTRAYNGDAP